MLTKMFKMMKKGNKGFTLVELMVVVVIIGVLTAIAVPVYNNVSTKAKINAIASNLRIINGAISQYHMANDGYPTAITDLVSDYIQTTPQNPKGVTYKVGATVANATSGKPASPCEAIAELDAETEIGDLEEGEYTIFEVQEFIQE